MNDNTRNEFASYGLEILKRSVLLVLYKQYVSGPSHKRSLRIGEIGKQLDIRPLERDKKHRPSGKHAYMNGLTQGILAHLLDDKQVEWLGEGHWRITEAGISVIEG